jgi:hypothetical protein
MKLMVACNTLTWVEVDTVSGDVGPARVFNLPENVNVEGRFIPDRQPTVLCVDPEFDDRISSVDRDRAIDLVERADKYEFVMEER